MAGDGRFLDWAVCQPPPAPGDTESVAIGTRWIIDTPAPLLLDVGTGPFTVDAGGDIRQVGGGAMCASATDRRVRGDGLHHVLDA